MRSTTTYQRRAAGIAAALACLITATSAHAASGAPTCDAPRAQTDQGQATTIEIHCDGPVDVRLDSPALHGVVSGVADGNGRVRYEPAQGWFSADDDDADRFVLIAANESGQVRVPVRVDVDPKTPTCDDRTVALEPEGATSFVLRCDMLSSDPQFDIVHAPAHGTLGVDQDSGRVTYEPTGAPVSDAFTFRATNDGGKSGVHTITLLGATDAPDPQAGGAAPPACTAPAKVEAFYVTPVSFTISCPADTDVTVSPAAHGRIVTSRSGSQTTVSYRSDVGYDDRTTATDPIAWTATSAGGTSVGQVQVHVRPYRFVAFGDSVTAGFGYYGDGDEMSSFKIASCKPRTRLNGRCSSNSTLRGGSEDDAPDYTSDFGLANNVSWAAQFANGLQGGKLKGPGQYANYAVTGSSPGDWLAIPGDASGSAGFPDGSGSFTPLLDRILREDPDLVAFTIGANPILSNMMPSLLGNPIWNFCKDSFTWNGTLNCLQERMTAPGGSEAVQLRAHLTALYRYLLSHTSHTTFVVMPYHLTIPTGTSAGWDWWQLEGAIDLLNNTIDGAVDDVRKAMPQQADRLLHVKAEWNPNAPRDPTKLARFNFGGSSFHLDPPSCVPASRSCSAGGEGDYGWDNQYNCHWYTHDSDGPSHQATVTQNASFYTSTCGGTPWILSSDSGIHPNRLGYTQFAAALTNLLAARGVVPPLP